MTYQMSGSVLNVPTNYKPRFEGHEYERWSQNILCTIVAGCSPADQQLTAQLIVGLAALPKYASEPSCLSHGVSDMAVTVFIDVHKDSAEWNASRLSIAGVDGALEGR